MCMILIQWCYFALTAFPVGFAALFFLERRFGYRVKSQVSVLMAGLLILNVYAQYFSLFAGVGIWANVLMCAFALAAAIALRKRIHTFLKQKTEETGRGRLLLYGFLVLLFAYGSSRGYMHYDTGLYHAQSIRWIEEYGVVPGLANLHSRFGYNSAAFALCALFGGGGLTKYPMHCVQGFFALLCAAVTFLAALSVHYGELHFYMLLAQITGFAVYYFTLDAFVQKITEHVAGVLKRVYRLLFRVLSAPVCLIVRIGEKIVKFFGFLRRKIEKNLKFLLQKMKPMLYNRNSFSRFKLKDRQRKRATSDEET